MVQAQLVSLKSTMVWPVSCTTCTACGKRKRAVCWCLKKVRETWIHIRTEVSKWWVSCNSDFFCADIASRCWNWVQKLWLAAVPWKSAWQLRYQCQSGAACTIGIGHDQPSSFWGIFDLPKLPHHKTLRTIFDKCVLQAATKVVTGKPGEGKQVTALEVSEWHCNAWIDLEGLFQALKCVNIPNLHRPHLLCCLSENSGT